MKEFVIVKNAIRCKNCGDVIESKHVHDFVTCSCGSCSVDGGRDYLRRCFKTQNPDDAYEDLSVTEEVETTSVKDELAGKRQKAETLDDAYEKGLMDKQEIEYLKKLFREIDKNRERNARDWKWFDCG